jgi:hypothetical protein
MNHTSLSARTLLGDQVFQLNVKSRAGDQDISDDFFAATGRRLLVPDPDSEESMQAAMREFAAITDDEFVAYHAYLVRREEERGRALPWEKT